MRLVRAMTGLSLTRPRVPALLLALVASLLLVLAVPRGGLPLHQSGWIGGADLTATPGNVEQEAAAALLAFDALQARSPGLLDVHWNPVTRTPDFLAGRGQAGTLPYTPTAAERGNPLAITLGFLDENRALFGLGSARADLQTLRVEQDTQLNTTHIRLAQVYRGLPVFGRQLVVHVTPDERISAVNGQFAPGIAVPTTPSIDAARAEAVALRDLREVQLDPVEAANVGARVASDQTRLMVYVDDAGKATLTWAITIATTAPLGQWRYFVNASRPVVVHAIDSVANGKERSTYTARNTTDLPGRLLIQEGEQSRDAIAQAAHDGAGKVYDYYFTTFKRDSLDGRGLALISTVHYGSDPDDAENAAWIGDENQMIFGDGGKTMKPLAYGLDVVGHEFTHGMIDNTSALVYEAQSGALNESYADVFGVLIAGTNWTIGGTIMKSPPYPIAYLRSLKDPNAQNNYDPADPLGSAGQPAHMREYAKLSNSRKNDNGGVHVNSGIPNRAAFLVAQALGNDRMQQIYYRTVTQYLTPKSNFADAAQATARAATELYGPDAANAVRNAFSQVGIDAGSGNIPTPSASPTPSRPPAPSTQPAPIPAGCSDLIANGGFETDQGWVQVSATHSALIDPELPHSGARSAWLGGTDEESFQRIYQEVRLPANATKVTLTYYRLIHEEWVGVLGLFADDATFSVAVTDAQGTLIGNVEQLTSSGGDDNWRQVSMDLSSLAGKTIRLAFTAENPQRNISSFFVDDVALAVCTTGATAPAPAPAAQDQVYVGGTVTNADTGRGVAGAQVYVLKPGVTGTQAAADGTLSSNEVLTSGVSDRNGAYQTQATIPRGQTYSIVVIAGGYHPVIADNALKVRPDASGTVEVNAKLRRGQ